MDLDQKEISYILKKYLKDNIKDKDLVKKYLAVPDYHFTMNSLALCNDSLERKRF